MNEPFFRSAEAKFCQILEAYLGPKSFTKDLYENEVKNLALFGYGAKGFMLSMIETALELTNYEIKGQDIQKLINMGKEILAYKIHIYDGVVEVLKYLHEKEVKVICITKGDLLDQESKVARSGLGYYFDKVHVVNDKSSDVYEKIINEHGIRKDEFLMVGNSLKSDILPVSNIGASTVYIPCDVPWAHEIIDEDQIKKDHHLKVESMLHFYNLLVKD